MGKKTVIITYEYDESKKDMLSVFGIDKDARAKLAEDMLDMVNEMGEEATYTMLLTGMLDSEKIDGSWLMCLASFATRDLVRWQQARKAMKEMTGIDPYELEKRLNEDKDDN